MLIIGFVLVGCEARTTLLQAVVEGDIAKVTAAIHRADEVNSSDELGRTVLIIAVQNDAEEIVSILLENGADPDIEYLGASALIYATLVPHCNERIVSALLNAGVSANQTPLLSGLTPLMGVAASGSKGCFDLLIDAGAEIEALDHAGNDIVFHAAMGGNASIVERVIALGAAPDNRNVQGTTPLMVAAALGSHALVVKLIDAGADPCAVDIRGRTPLDVAAQNDHGDTLSQVLTCSSPGL